MSRPARPAAPARGRPPAGRTGFTLVELLVAATLALVVMAALASLFGIFGRAVSNSQELVQLAARMRSTAWRLRQDLQGITTEVKPFIRPESAGGYFELVEGPLVETGASMVADVDDILMMTTASQGVPFTGVLSGALVESPYAEVAWFCKRAPPTADGLQLFNLYRRQLLVSAAPGAGPLLTTNNVGMPATWDAWYQSNDLSVRREGAAIFANSLADLTRRQSRFLHNVTGTLSNRAPQSGNLLTTAAKYTWPQITTTSTVAGMSDILSGVREGEDLLLSNVVAFDVRVFDPQLQATSTAYVDLGAGGSTVLAGTPTLVAAGTPLAPSATSGGMQMNTTVTGTSYKFYDTWSIAVESNNVPDKDPPNTPATTTWDAGTDLVDSNGNSVADDAAELERPPPYNVPLRGIEVRIRCYEPSSQEVRQVTIQHTFLAR